MKTKVIIELSERWLKVTIGRKVSVDPILNTDPATIAALLTSVFKQSKCGKDLEVFVVLSRNKITVRRVDLPSQDPKEIEQMLGLYLIRQIPYHKEEVFWAYQNLGFDGISNSHILLAIALKNMFRNIVTSFGPLNLLPESILMSSQGLIHYVSDALKDKSVLQGPYLILDIDTNYSELILVNKQKLNSSVVLAQGAEQLKDEREKDRFIVELKQGLVAFNSEVPDVKAERLFLSGASEAQLVIVEAALARDFNIKAQYVSTKDYDSFNPGQPKELSLSAALGFSSQVARDDIKFILPELQIKKEMQAKARQLMVLGVCLVYIFIMFCAIGLVRMAQKQSYSANLKAKVKSLAKDTQELEDITNKLKVAKQYVNPKASVLTLLYELSRFCPEGITITNFNWELGKTFSFRGYAQQIPDILAFTNTLSNSEYFKGAQNRYTRRRTVKDREMVDFEIVIK
ncbi:MAG: PilN domain-containing protein [Candidatus Omnitrophica bacterium]|nr:PilN domain-containing protein [Candidatus Omnitrophota bacterium]